MQAAAGCDWLYKPENKHILYTNSSGRTRNQTQIPPNQAIWKGMNLKVKTLLLTQQESKAQHKWSMLATAFNLGMRKKALNVEASKSRRATFWMQLCFERVSTMRSPVPIWERTSPNVPSKPPSLQVWKCSHYTTAPFSYITHWDPDSLQTTLCCISNNANSKAKVFLLRRWEAVLQVTLGTAKTHTVLFSDQWSD